MTLNFSAFSASARLKSFLKNYDPSAAGNIRAAINSVDAAAVQTALSNSLTNSFRERDLIDYSASSPAVFSAMFPPVEPSEPATAVALGNTCEISGQSTKSNAYTLFNEPSLPVLSGGRYFIDEETGEIRTGQFKVDGRGVFRASLDGNLDASRQDRYSLQDAARQLMPRSRTAKCLRSIQSGASEVQVLKTEHGCHFGNLQTCGSVWACPVCAAKVSERRREELQTAVNAHKAAGGSILFVTYTFPHSVEHDLKDLLKRFAAARASLKAHRNYKQLMKYLRVIGSVRALEVTHGANGWHPHIHELLFIDGPDVVPEDVSGSLYSVWRWAALRHGFTAPSKEHGVTVQNGDFAAAYVSKWGHEPTGNAWGVDAELTSLNRKNGKNDSCTPFDLLRRYRDGHENAGKLFVEFAEAFRGQRQLFWSRGLKQRFEITDLSDDEIAALREESAERLGTISRDDWRRVLVSGQRYTVLLLSAVNAWEVVESFIRGLPSVLPRPDRVQLE